MSTIIFIVVIFCLLVFPVLRCILMNPHNMVFYGYQDLFEYFVYKKWTLFTEFGIDMYVGMFGHGKTLSMTHKARQLHKRYGDSICFISNYKLIGIPYIPLVNFNQLVDLGTESTQYQGYVVLIDEISSVLSHRNYASFPLELVGLLCQQRKRHIYIMCTAQRFFMVDKIWRSITTNVIDCNKYWRLQNMVKYDAWELENSMNQKLIQKLSNRWWFVKNSDFNTYDTSQMIDKNMVKDFISNEESMARKGLDSTVNELAVKKPSRKLRKIVKKK